MLLGLGSDAEIKTAVRKAVTGGSGPQTHLDFENKLNREYFIKEIFQSLDWNDLYEKKDWWDVFGWDRAERMKRVETIVDEVMTEMKIESCDSVSRDVNKVEVMKSWFPFFKKQELAALATSTDELRSADATFWNTALQKVERKKPQECTDPNAWAAVMNLSKEDVEHFKTLIRKGVDPKYLPHLSTAHRKILSHIGHLYRDLRLNRDLLPDHVRKLFRACDKSNLVLFAVERKISEHRPIAEKSLSVSILKELNEKANGEMIKSDTLGSFPVLKELQPNFSTQKFKVLKQFPKSKEVSVWISEMNTFIHHLSMLSGQGNETFNRAVQATLLQQALNGVSGKRPGALGWQISELTKDPGSGVSLSPEKEIWTTEIHDSGEGKVRIDHIVQAKILDDKIDIGSLSTHFSYTLSLSGEKYSLSKLEIGKTLFEWNERTDTPFHSLKGGDLQEVFKRYCDPLNSVENPKKGTQMFVSGAKEALIDKLQREDQKDSHYFFGGNRVD
jgi:hypothetical protein